MRPLVLCVLLALLPFTDGIAGEVIHHPTLKFSLRAPDGMERQRTMEQDEVIFVFARDSDRVPGRMILVRVVRYGGLAEDVRSAPSDLPAGARLELARWKDFNLQVTRRVLREDYLTFVALVPLKPEAVLVSVVGAPEDEAELRALVNQMLAGLDGETNWTTPGPSDPGIWVGLAISVAFMAMTVAFFRWIRRRPRRHKVADLAAAERWWRGHGRPREHLPDSGREG